MMSDFLQISSMNYEIKHAFIKYHESVTKIQHAWLRLKSNNEFRIILLTRMWDKEVQTMVMY